MLKLQKIFMMEMNCLYLMEMHIALMSLLNLKPKITIHQEEITIEEEDRKKEKNAKTPTQGKEVEERKKHMFCVDCSTSLPFGAF
jgi:5'-3' exonuclease